MNKDFTETVLMAITITAAVVSAVCLMAISREAERILRLLADVIEGRRPSPIIIKMPENVNIVVDKQQFAGRGECAK